MSWRAASSAASLVSEHRRRGGRGVRAPHGRCQSARRARCSYAASPALGDLDGDGDPDLVTGASDGTFAVHYLPERGHGALLGAGAALLAWLRRLRGKRHP